jgi:hypothetical protein
MSILTGSSLSESHIFVPPFNKWNKDTEEICEENKIWLVKFEHGWRCLEYEPFDEKHELWYLHARELSIDNIEDAIS